MSESSAVLAAVALLALFALHMTALVGLTLGRRQLPGWMAPFAVRAGGWKRVAATVWAAALSVLSQAAAISVILRPSLADSTRVVFIAELAAAGYLTFWLLSRRVVRD
jgi:hypothetical protein